MPPTITIFSPGPYATNCYVLESSDHLAIIDAGFEPADMIEFLNDRITKGAILDALLLTHAHVDHIAGVADVRRAFPSIKVLIHEAEKDWLGDSRLNLSMFSGFPIATKAPDRLLKNNDSITIGDCEFEVRHTPGHSLGSVTYFNAANKFAFVGDALFAGSIGRTDFPGCSFERLEKSIRERLYTLPDDTRVLPGHGPATTIGREATSNPFVKR
jgi:glyoxylase-like metal-dependent hydrolase (beta-lactamase superfamily II)